MNKSRFWFIRFFQDYIYACDHRGMTVNDLEEWFLGRGQIGISLSVCPLTRINSLQLIAWFDLISWCVASHGTHILSWGKSVQKSLIALSQSIHTEAVQHFHVSITLFDSGVGCSFCAGLKAQIRSEKSPPTFYKSNVNIFQFALALRGFNVLIPSPWNNMWYIPGGNILPHRFF